MSIIFPNSSIESKIESGNNVLEFSQPLSKNFSGFLASRLAANVGAGIVYPFDIERYDFVGNSYDDTSYRFTAQVAGLYWIYCWTMLTNNTTRNNDYYDILVNGVVDNRTARCYSSNTGSVYGAMERGTLVELQVGDYVHINTGTAVLYGLAEVYVRFCGVYIG